ncbi:putative transcription factor MYB-related family [Helianthus annuus]|uniref:Putative duplicated homeodomain-like superfamily protein n=1 Tax=Helianthus annuus TaxID=4232 RepID=A0A251VS29_HELAN|nr:transcription factor SRM1 [Helianthus annuus]KAF5761931.1 putative transcription factor MYB-related family [Helianthus annuus]KAJ0439700.1 putative transcription factor MYB-HB-like family [Helianthus annuus]KAJ0642483.1 putative transcription factor MYB-HB-like family [Helianthus annuus]KAJ0646357.1 putative transcription factor MYB-HB-like family [Helianthus annuus]KAJ0823029.1 putative transcription factor MYB-HB-like family [Helianthus annuus]
MSDKKVKESVWSREQDIAFENALVSYPDEDDEERWEKIAAEVPGNKSVEEIKNHYELLLEDLERIESGVVPLPVYSSSLDDSESQAGDVGTSKKGGNAGQNVNESNHGGKGSKSEQERRKGIAWTEEEHRLFLLGLEKYGKGDWRSISRNFVVTRTPTQVASHAQKYFIRLNSMNKDRRRSSIHDITSVNNADVAVPQPPTNSSPGKSTKPPTTVNMYGGTAIGQPVVGTPVNLVPAPHMAAYGVGTPVVPGAPSNMDPRASRRR